MKTKKTNFFIYNDINKYNIHLFHICFFENLKVIVLLTSDTSELKEPEKVRASQEKALQALQQYTIARYPEMPAKFGELLLRIPDLQRTCQAGKELLSAKRAEGEGSSFNLLMELLRGDH